MATSPLGTAGSAASQSSRRGLGHARVVLLAAAARYAVPFASIRFRQSTTYRKRRKRTRSCASSLNRLRPSWNTSHASDLVGHTVLYRRDPPPKARSIELLVARTATCALDLARRRAEWQPYSKGGHQDATKLAIKSPRLAVPAQSTTRMGNGCRTNRRTTPLRRSLHGSQGSASPARTPQGTSPNPPTNSSPSLRQTAAATTRPGRP